MAWITEGYNRVDPSKLDVAVIGALNLDLIIKGTAPKNLTELQEWSGPSDSVHMLTAGAVGYFLQVMVKMGWRCGILSHIADDPLSLIILDTLKTIGVDTGRLVRESDTQSAIAIFMLLFGSKKRPLTYRMPTHEGWSPAFTNLDIDYICQAKHLHCGGLLHFPNVWGQGNLMAFQRAKEQGLTTSLDPQFPLSPMDPPWVTPIRDFLTYTDLLFVDRTEALNLVGQDDVKSAAVRLLDMGPEIVAIKLGAEGCFVKSNREEWILPAVPVDPIEDSIGAGDCFDAGFLTGYLKGQSLEECTRFALGIAGESLKGTGGAETVPHWQDFLVD